ncbi:MAG TPA: inositol monophosphatase family protein [Candidatus Limnocylindrales bacterium]
MTDAIAEYGAEWSAGLRRGPESEIRGWVEFGLSLCAAADAIALRWFRRDVKVSRKADRSFVTEADTAIEQLLRDRIADAHPGHGVVGEEFGTMAADASVRWYIDPIDGTHNFIRGLPLFGTLLAVERDGELQAAVISAPALRERWYGWRGGGAWGAGAAGNEGPRRIHVSDVAALSDAQILYGSGRDIDGSGRAPGFRSLLDAVWRERGVGDFWGYALVAEGAAEAMLEVDLSPWDAAAPTLLVEEAGGRVTDLDGTRSFSSPTFLSTNGRLHDELLARLTTHV